VTIEQISVFEYAARASVMREGIRGWKSAGMPTNLPEGWSYDAVYGELPRGATDARFNLLAGLTACPAASASSDQEDAERRPVRFAPSLDLSGKKGTAVTTDITTTDVGSFMG
jgi:hypothetical protein